MADVHHIKAAINTVRSCNWLYKSVGDSSVDESTKHIIEVSNNATSKMLVLLMKLMPSRLIQLGT